MSYQLAQLNIARFKLPQADPVNADFVKALDRVNHMAEQQPGFVWRFTGEGNNAMDVQAFTDPNVVINLSVWKDLDALADFVYRNDEHLQIMRRRKEWFAAMDVYLVLWWIKQGDVPSVAEAKTRLAHLQSQGPTPYAFSFREPFPAPDGGDVKPVLDVCA